MNTQANGGIRSGKVTAILVLYVTAALIVLAGVAFCAYSLINNVQFAVMRVYRG